MAFELRTVAGIPRPTDRTSFQRLSVVRKNTLYALWQVDPSVEFRVRVTDSRLNAWMPLLGATPDPDDANVACLDIFRLEYLFLPAFSLDPALVDTDAGDSFVVPGRLHDALVALVDAGLDLAIDPSITGQNGLGPSVLLARIKAAVPKLAALLVLTGNDFIDVKESDDDDVDVQWPSLIKMGQLICPQSGSLSPLAHLRGLQGSYLHPDVRDRPTGRYQVISNAIAAKAMSGSLAALGSEHKSSQVAKFIIDTAWESELEMALLNWPAALTDVDARAQFQTEDVSKRSAVLRDRFEVIMTHHSSTRQWVTGATSSQQFSVALSLAEELLDLKEPRSLTALRSLDTFLSSRMELLTSNVMALSPPQRASHIIGYVKTMKDSRPSGGSSSSDGASSFSATGGQSSSQIGYIFKAGNAFSAQIEAFLVSKSVCAPLSHTVTHDEKGAEVQVVDDVNSGLLALLQQPSVRGNAVEVCRLAYLRYEPIVAQFFATKCYYQSELFQLLAAARLELPDFFSVAVITDDRGHVRRNDEGFKLDEAYVTAIARWGFDSVNHYNHLIVALECKRAGIAFELRGTPKMRQSSAIPTLATSLEAQWNQPRSAELVVLVDRIANCLGCPRGDAVGGLAALWTQIELFTNRAPEGIDRQDLRSSMMQKALEPPSSRGRHMLSCPPGTATVSRAFLHEDDECWSALTNADDATEDLMKIEKILPGALTAINKFRAGDAAPSGKGAGRGAGKNDGGGGGNGGGRGGGKGKSKRRATDDANSPPPKQPTYQGFSLTPGSTSHNCSWSSSSGGAGSDVLTISRQYLDQTTGKNVDLPDLVVDVAKFCKANGVKQADYCWEFVASYFWSSFDRATNALADKGSNRVKRAMRIACSRCPKSSDTSKHPEGLMAMHAMPKNVNNLVTYFQ